MSAIVLFAGASVLAMALAAVGSAASQSRAAAAAMEASWRAPGAAGSIRTTMLLGLVFLEALALFVFAVVFVLAGRVTPESGAFAVGAVLAMALAAIGSAVSQSRAAVAAMEASWRAPGAAGSIRTTMMLGLVFMEALTLFVFAIVFVLAGRVTPESGPFAAGAVLAMAIAAIGSALAQGGTAASALKATWKRPEEAGSARTSMMLALVFMEALTLFVFAIVFVLAGRVG
jgi:F-type H+-transporting ATPase subunit c